MKEIIAIPQDDGPIQIDTSQIPAVEVKLLSKATLDFVLPISKYIMSNPIERRRFEEWKATREKEASNG